MKNLIVALLAVLLGAAFYGTAQAAPLYLNLHVGATTQVNVNGFNTNDGNTYGGAVGTAVGPVRVEVGIDRHNTSFAGIVQGSATVYNASGFLDTASGFYGGGGVDWAQASGRIYTYKANDQGFGYHVAGGYARRVADNVIIDAQARYTHLDVFGGASDVIYTIGARVAI